jgi:hypothetical protein
VLSDVRARVEWLAELRSMLATLKIKQNKKNTNNTFTQNPLTDA